MRAFKAPFWARSGHVQTLVPFFFKVPMPSLRRERFELPDGDFVDLDWGRGPQDPTGPIVVLLHGLEGSANSHYIRRMVRACVEAGLAVAVHHHRGCSGTHNRLPRTYHSGDTGDIKVVLERLRERHPKRLLWVAGYSLGGNVLVKMLGEMGADAPVDVGVSVSAPLRLDACSDRLNKGFSRVYQRRLLSELRTKTGGRITTDIAFAKAVGTSAESIETLRSFRDFDDAVTAPANGFASAADYYDRCSGLPFVAHIRKPTLILHAVNDPFMTPAVVPDSSQLSPSVRYELANGGGHVGFIDGGLPWRPRFYLERRILAFFEAAR